MDRLNLIAKARTILAANKSAFINRNRSQKEDRLVFNKSYFELLNILNDMYTEEYEKSKQVKVKYYGREL